ncbi:MAG: hypothetical protein ACREF4_05040 [Gammaproteobacteria bacterium]
MNRRRTLTTSRSTRTLAEACALAGLLEPRSAHDVPETYLLLLVQGIGHRSEGTQVWADAIMFGAPREWGTR